MTILAEAVKASPPVQAAKIVVLTVIAVLILGLTGTSWYFFNALQDATENNTILKEANASLKQDLELVKIGQTAMGLGQLLTEQKKQELDVKARETRTTLKQKEQDIDRSASAPEEKARMKSEARMDSVWSMYCHVQPTNAICQTQGAAK
jgi:hypothetical protein